MHFSYPTADGRVIIRCSTCLTRLRVPVDRGRISVTCPTCRKEFIYNPNSVLHTLKQIGLSAAAMLPRNRKTRILALAGALLALAALILLLSGLLNRKAPEQLRPGPGRTVIRLMQNDGGSRNL